MPDPSWHGAAAALDPRRSRLFVWGGGTGTTPAMRSTPSTSGRCKWTRLSDPSRPDAPPARIHTRTAAESAPHIQLHRVSARAEPADVLRGCLARTVGRHDTQDLGIRSGHTRVDHGQARGCAGRGNNNMGGAHARLDPVSGDVFVLQSQQADSAALFPDRGSLERWMGAATCEFTQRRRSTQSAGPSC